MIGVCIVFQKVGVRKRKEAPEVVAGGPQKKTLQRKRSIKEGERLFSLSVSPGRLFSVSVYVAFRTPVAANSKEVPPACSLWVWFRLPPCAGPDETPRQSDCRGVNGWCAGSWVCMGRSDCRTHALSHCVLCLLSDV